MKNARRIKNKIKSDIELVRYRHEDQSQLSKHLGNLDFKTFGGFITIQLTVCAFLMHMTNELNGVIKFAFMLIDICLCIICGVMLYNHMKRREEVTQTIKNCNKYLGYDEVGRYLENETINTETKNRFWFPAYAATISVLWLAFALILYYNEISECFSSTKTVVCYIIDKTPEQNGQ